MAKSKMRTGKKVDPIVIFRYADAFVEAAEMLNSQARKTATGVKIVAADAALSSPMLTLDIFALELYLKCLHAIDHSGDPGWGHDPWALFDDLKDGTQKAIRFTYIQQLKTSPIVDLVNKNEPGLCPTLDRCLHDATHFFEDIRYFFAEPKRGKQIFIWPLVRVAVRDAILATYPRWRK